MTVGKHKGLGLDSSKLIHEIREALHSQINGKFSVVTAQVIKDNIDTVLRGYDQSGQIGA